MKTESNLSSAPGAQENASSSSTFWSSINRDDTNETDETSSHLSAPRCGNCNAVDESHVRRVRDLQPNGNSRRCTPSSSLMEEHYKSEWEDNTSNMSWDECSCQECRQRKKDVEEKKTDGVRSAGGQPRGVGDQSSQSNTTCTSSSSVQAQQKRTAPTKQTPTRPTILLVVLNQRGRNNVNRPPGSIPVSQLPPRRPNCCCPLRTFPPPPPSFLRDINQYSRQNANPNAAWKKDPKIRKKARKFKKNSLIKKDDLNKVLLEIIQNQRNLCFLADLAEPCNKYNGNKGKKKKKLRSPFGSRFANPPFVIEPKIIVPSCNNKCCCRSYCNSCGNSNCCCW